MSRRIDPEQLASSLHLLHRSVKDDELLPVLQRILDGCDNLFQLTGCGLLLEDAEHGLQYAASTSAASRHLEEAQARLTEGPCVDAFVTGDTIDTEDLTFDPRWPGLAREAAELNVHAVLGCPVSVEGITVGSLDVYLNDRRVWDDSERHAIEQFAAMVGAVIESALVATRASDIAEQLRTALASRVVIERAVGYLMASEQLSATEAFERLRAAARRQRRKIAAVASHLLNGGTA